MTALPPSRERVVLGLLHSVEKDATRSQRTMAQEFGVALGLINTTLRYCVRKGYVRVKRVPARRYTYFLTPKGITEKTRLTVSHLSHSLSFFRQARQDCEQVFAHAEANRWLRLAVAGGGELADIAYLCADGRKAALVGMIDPNTTRTRFHGMPIVAEASRLPPFDAVIVTDQAGPQQTYDLLINQLTPERVLTLEALRISRRSSDTQAGTAKAS